MTRAERRKFSQERLNRAFALYRVISSRMENCMMARGMGRLGISVENDAHAKSWQRLEWRREVLSAWISDRPPCWYLARWLPVEEMDRRTKEDEK